jgi:microcystin-dependent protein
MGELTIDAFVGEIRMFGGASVPTDWAFCDGTLLPKAQYDVLYALIGKTYGGDGVNNFALPDLRGRVPLHQGGEYALGQSGGVESVVLLADQVGTHTHTARAKAGPGDRGTPAGNVWATAPDARYSANPPTLAMKAAVVGYTGDDEPHNNLMPFRALNYIICLNGLDPRA